MGKPLHLSNERCLKNISQNREQIGPHLMLTWSAILIKQ
jgi:hypothetical protein